ncbi:MAG: phosphodiester glycosidase family protein [Campylobacterota bacterium]|nr:phosphodiester glycosidase family protein [Campylobacterota bacterium]
MKRSVLSMWLTTMILFASNEIIAYKVNPKDITFYSKDAQGQNYANFAKLKMALKQKNKELVFAMNGGMYLPDLSPQGLYTQEGKVLKKIEKKQEAFGNFYMQPNGIFYISKEGKAFVTTSKKFVYNKAINYATQSGSMLIIDGKLHHKFMPHSKNLHIRNGVGVLPNGDLLFAISKERINFYDFASFFKKQGCKNALYLDGFVSRIYLPQKKIMHDDGTFGVIIAEVRDEKVR